MVLQFITGSEIVMSCKAFSNSVCNTCGTCGCDAVDMGLYLSESMWEVSQL